MKSIWRKWNLILVSIQTLRVILWRWSCINRVVEHRCRAITLLQLNRWWHITGTCTGWWHQARNPRIVTTCFAYSLCLVHVVGYHRWSSENEVYSSTNLIQPPYVFTSHIWNKMGPTFFGNQLCWLHEKKHSRYFIYTEEVKSKDTSHLVA